MKGIGADTIRLWGHSGQIVLERGALRFHSLRRIGDHAAQTWHMVELEPLDGHALFLDHMRQQIKDGVRADLEEPGYRTLGVVMAAYRSSETGLPVDVETVLAGGSP